MAKSHSTNGQPDNPDIRFERTDIDIGNVVNFSIALSVILLVTGVLVLWFTWTITQQEAKEKVTSLPPAAVDKDLNLSQPPSPRLEAIEDMEAQKKKDFAIYPARAADYYRKQTKLLREGNAEEKIEPIAKAMEQIQLQGRDIPPPAGYGITLPSKAAAGRVTTGAQ